MYGRDEVESHFYLFPKIGLATLQSRPRLHWHLIGLIGADRRVARDLVSQSRQVNNNPIIQKSKLETKTRFSEQTFYNIKKITKSATENDHRCKHRKFQGEGGDSSFW